MRGLCQICGNALQGAERSIGTCINCVHEVRYKPVRIKDAGYSYGTKREKRPGTDGATPRR